MFTRVLSSDTAIFVCDIQGAFVKSVYAVEELINSSAFLLKCARILEVPCIVTEQYPERLQPTVDYLQPFIIETENQKAYPVYSKVDYTMYSDEVKQYLKEKLPSVINIIICGLETHVCVFQTCMDLVNAGYVVHVCVDAVSSRSVVDRKVALNRMQHNGVQLTTTESIVFQIMGSKNHPSFKAISGLVKEKSFPDHLDI